MILLVCGLLKTELIYKREINPQKIEKKTTYGNQGERQEKDKLGVWD